jgi:phenylacetate-coenzyme A ligase PaaK-like adenylate-forming protein
VQQTQRLLRSQRPHLLFTTSKLLLALAATLEAPLAEFGVRAVCTGGTSCTAEEARFVRGSSLGDGVQWIDTYGNTLMGHALQGDAWDGWPRRANYLLPPQAYIRVVDPMDWRRHVDYGQRGRVLVITLLEDLFVPNLLERDSAIRVRPHPWFPWDGVSDVALYTGPGGEPQTEGVY